MRVRGALLFVGLALSGISPLTAVELNPSARLALAKVRRIYVDQLGGGAGSDQIRDMIITAMQNSGLFVLTENPEKADAILKGSSDFRVFIDEHQTNDSIGLHASEASGNSAGANLGTNSSAHQSLSTGITESDSSHSKEHKQEAGASVRLVGVDGDVIWSTTQESGGAKFRGALADVADKIARRLADETKSARAAVAVLTVK